MAAHPYGLAAGRARLIQAIHAQVFNTARRDRAPQGTPAADDPCFVEIATEKASLGPRTAAPCADCQVSPFPAHPRSIRVCAGTSDGRVYEVTIVDVVGYRGWMG